MKYRVKVGNFTFGVPMGFLGYKYNAEQFRLIGIGTNELGRSIGVGATITDEEWAAIKRDVGRPSRGTLMLKDKDGKYSSPYARVLIKRRFR